MLVSSDKLKVICSKLLNALDSDSTSVITETVALNASNNILTLSVTNMEYLVKTKMDITTDEEFNATVNADVFLKLINQLTTPSIELTIENNILIVKGNGIYKLPMIYENDKLLVLPDITIKNVINEFDLSLSSLMAIYNYNSKELNKNLIGSSPVQKLYYVDKEGCITFTSGACVTTFSVPEQVKFLISPKLVKLFKLFTDSSVHICFGKDDINNEITQTKLLIKDSLVELIAILPSDNTLLSMVPKDNIRQMAKQKYPYTISISKDKLSESINRLLLFMPSNLYIQPLGRFEFFNSFVKLYDRDKHNEESITYITPIELTSESEELILDLNDVKVMLDNVKEDNLTIHFGNHQAIVIERPNIYNIIPECVL